MHAVITQQVSTLSRSFYLALNTLTVVPLQVAVLEDAVDQDDIDRFQFCKGLVGVREGGKRSSGWKGAGGKRG